MLFIDENKLETLLAKNKEFIGISHVETIFSIFAYIVAIVETFLSFDFKSTWVIVTASILILFYIIFIVYGVNKFTKAFKRKMNSEIMFQNIKSLSDEVSRHSLAIIKDTFNEFPKRYLLYYDERWKCYLFPNYKTTNNNETDIIQRLSNELEIKEENIKLNYKAKDIHSKYSVSHEKNRTYEHMLYQVNIVEFTDVTKRDVFSLGGKHYKWFTYEDMITNSEIKENNMDIVSFVREFIG